MGMDYKVKALYGWSKSTHYYSTFEAAKNLADAVREMKGGSAEIYRRASGGRWILMNA